MKIDKKAISTGQQNFWAASSWISIRWTQSDQQSQHNERYK